MTDIYFVLKERESKFEIDYWILIPNEILEVDYFWGIIKMHLIMYFGNKLIDFLRWFSELNDHKIELNQILLPIVDVVSGVANEFKEEQFQTFLNDTAVQLTKIAHKSPFTIGILLENNK